MKKLALTSLLISQLCLPSLLMADDENGEAPPSPVIGNVVTMRAPDGSIEQPVLSQPGPADDMLFNRLHPEVKAPEKKVPVIALQVDGIENGQRIPDKYVYCAPDGNGGTINGGNVSPAIHWQDLPADTKSLVLMVVDTDVPAKLDDANKPGIEIRARAPRQDFYHWIVTGISPSSLGWFEGASSNGVTPGANRRGGMPTASTS